MLQNIRLYIKDFWLVNSVVFFVLRILNYFVNKNNHFNSLNLGLRNSFYLIDYMKLNFYLKKCFLFLKVILSLASSSVNKVGVLNVNNKVIEENILDLVLLSKRRVFYFKKSYVLGKFKQVSGFNIFFLIMPELFGNLSVLKEVLSLNIPVIAFDNKGAFGNMNISSFIFVSLFQKKTFFFFFKMIKYYFKSA